jgi:hypothetical protein
MLTLNEITLMPDLSYPQVDVDGSGVRRLASECLQSFGPTRKEVLERIFMRGCIKVPAPEVRGRSERVLSPDPNA